MSYWTNERVATLTRRWEEGASCSQIALELGDGVTRNAIIGKVHRLGLAGAAPRRRPSASLPRAPKPRTIRVAPRKHAALGAAVAVRREPAPVREAPPPIARLSPAQAARPLPHAKPVKLEDLTGCHWPHGDGPFTFCNEPVEPGQRAAGKSPYCPVHAIAAVRRD